MGDAEGAYRRLCRWWCEDVPCQPDPALSRALLLLAFLVHTYLWQGGLTAFIHDLTGSRANVDLENEEGGLHEFPENLATEWARSASVHPAVLAPFLVTFEPNLAPAPSAEHISNCLTHLRSLLLVCWVLAACLLFSLHFYRKSTTLRASASVACVFVALVNFYFQGFAARLSDPLVPAWAMVFVAVAQVADGGKCGWPSGWCCKALLALLCLCYFLAGCYKLSACGLEWMDGRVLSFYAKAYMAEESWSAAMYSAMDRHHVWPALCSCGLLFELLCPVALVLETARRPVIFLAIIFHVGNLCLITLNGDRFLSWVWILLFILDVPASLFRMALGLQDQLMLEGQRGADAFLLDPPVLAEAKMLKEKESAGVRHACSVGTTLLLALWLSTSLFRCARLTHTDWPFVAPDMFSRVGVWSLREPFPDVLAKAARPRKRLRFQEGAMLPS
ncbi:unnamed protein product [Effrenium voratum]|nr:unnamed protein product [Effrenium voratum]